MSAPPLPCYGTNVHPAEDLAGVLRMIEGRAAAVREAVSPGGILGLGLWLPARAAAELAGSPDAVAATRARLAAHGLTVVTVNAFPAGGFHGPRVKEGAYRPDWGDPARLEYTRAAARAAAALVGPGATCVVSTLPGTWKGWHDGPAERRTLARGLVEAATFLADLADGTGTRIVLAPEPEPGCTLETVEEVLGFWRDDLPREAGKGARADRVLSHLGLCADLCHLAVAGEDPAAALRRLRRAGVPVAKVQVSAALAVEEPATDPAAVEALRRFDEPRWLHQVGARDRLGVIRRARDLPEVFADLPAWTARRAWRVHFHAPIHREAIEGVRTTSALVPPAIAAALEPGAPPPVFEVETYTWSAVPGFSGTPAELVRGIAAELAFARRAMESSSPGPAVAHNPVPR